MIQSTALHEPLLTRQEAAEYLGLSKHALAEWASTGRYSLKFYRIGRRCMYRRSDIEAFITTRGVGA
jgi:excisionase family DNA binding protein